MWERRGRVIESVVGGLIGFGVAVGTIGLGMLGMQAIGLDSTPLLVFLVTVGSGFAYGCVQVGAALVRMVSLLVRARRYARAGRWAEFVPLGRELAERSESYHGFNDRETVRRRDAVILALLMLGRFDEAGQLAARNAWSLSRTLGQTHPDTADAQARVQIIRQASQDEAAAEQLGEALREHGPSSRADSA